MAKLTKHFLSYTTIEVETYLKQFNCKLLSEYSGIYTDKIKIECYCGNIFLQSFQVFKNSKNKSCEYCRNKINWDFEKVSEFVKEQNAVLISTNYKKNSDLLMFECVCCHKYFQKRFADFKNSKKNTCKNCSGKQGNISTFSYNEVKQTINEMGCELLDTTYENSKKLLNIRCKCGNIYKQTLSIFKTRKFNECIECGTTRMKDQNLEKYGVEHSSQKHISQETLNKLNNKEWMYNEHIIKENSLLKISKELNISDSTTGRYLKKHGIETQNFSSSEGEKELGNFIEGLGIDIKRNDRSVIGPLELDIVIPERKLAIEYCGLYWHNEFSGKDQFYHKNKMEFTNNAGYRLITMFENEWLDNKDLVKNKIKHLVGKSTEKPIFARKTSCCEIEGRDKKRFFDTYHIQGDGPGSIKIGLIHNHQIVSVMAFINTKNAYTLNRFASSVSVIGGFSKLLKFFLKNFPRKPIESFADLRWSEGDLYEKNGFKLVQINEPDYYYFYKGQIFHKFNFRLKKLPNLLDNFDPKLTERENCFNNGVPRIWTCGLKKYVL